MYLWRGKRRKPKDKENEDRISICSYCIGISSTEPNWPLDMRSSVGREVASDCGVCFCDESKYRQERDRKIPGWGIL
jgi:hypothetical protein